VTLTGLIVGAGHFADIQLEAWQDVQGARITGVQSLTIENARISPTNMVFVLLIAGIRRSRDKA
jgi:hypothetical protein